MPIGSVGGGGGSFPADGARSGTYIYGDLQYDSADFNVPGTGAYIDIPNDAAGAITKNFVVNGITNVWDAATQRFDFSEAEVGDVMEVRLDLSVTTSAPNQSVKVKFTGAIGTPDQFELSFFDTAYKTAGAHEMNRYTPVFMTVQNDVDFPGVLQIASDAALVVRNIRLFVHVVKRGL